MTNNIYKTIFNDINKKFMSKDKKIDKLMVSLVVNLFFIFNIYKI